MERSASFLARQAPTIRYDLHGKRQAYDGNAYNGKLFMFHLHNICFIIIPCNSKLDEIFISVSDEYVFFLSISFQ